MPSVKRNSGDGFVFASEFVLTELLVVRYVADLWIRDQRAW